MSLKPINLTSLIHAKNTLSSDVEVNNYLDFFGINTDLNDSNNKMKRSELDDLKKLHENLLSNTGENLRDSIKISEGYFLGYKIPQINEEFDLLRFGTKYIINIEIKSISTYEKIKKQLLRKKYYLSFLEKEIHLFTYVSSTNKLYRLGNDENITEVDLVILYNMLLQQQLDIILNVDNLFNPLNYLVSPFNSTKKFMEEKYFLTQQQNNIKRDIIGIIKNSNSNFISITGSAGTGKTLLTYDIAKTLLMQNMRVLILHCAKLNSGQFLLKNDYQWNIQMARPGLSEDFSNYDLIIIDEAQRMTSHQLKTIYDKVKLIVVNCIFSYDQKQCLHDSESFQNISEQVKEIIHNNKPFKLTNKIRTNEEIASFIKSFFNEKKQKNINASYSNIELCYFQERKQVMAFLEHMSTNNWTVPRYTDGRTTTFQYEEYQLHYGENTHEIIGQEYDNVVAVVDEHYAYCTKGNLAHMGGGYYSMTKMLFQIMTRARKKLYIVIINNEEMLKRCLEILN
ncbi:ATP-binding protein [Lentisphaerota bacterium WC36G]|nr:ATP-binding protein [Lentisphaerae bacterium WC36]